MREVMAELGRVLQQRLACVYCLVVATRGSTPQKAGAAMLVFPDGRQVGTLGGGCIEAEVKRQALAQFHQACRCQLHTFTLDHDYGWDDGLICGGRMTILSQTLDGGASENPGPDAGTVRTGGTTCPTGGGDDAGHAAALRRYYLELVRLAEEGEGFWEAVALDDTSGVPPAARFLLDAAGRCVAHIGGPAAAAERLAAELPPLASRPRPWSRGGIAYLPAPPRCTLLIVGGGHVGLAVAQLAAAAEFDIWVLDDRERYASAERFPMARRRLVGDIGRTLRELTPQLTPRVYAVIVTRGHNHDEEALYHLATSGCGYVGMIGSRRKVRLIFEDLHRRGVPMGALQRVRAPLGAPIGSQTVPEIAISIVAELIAWRNLGPQALPWGPVAQAAPPSSLASSSSVADRSSSMAGTMSPAATSEASEP